MIGLHNINPLDTPVTIMYNLNKLKVGIAITILWAANRTKRCVNTTKGPVIVVISHVRDCPTTGNCVYKNNGYCTTRTKEIFIKEHNDTEGYMDLCSSIIKNVTTKETVEAILKRNINGILDNYRGISIDSFKFNERGVVIGFDWPKK